MALDLSKLNFFSRLDARSRVFVLFGILVGIIFIIYLGTKYLTGESSAIGPSNVANAPRGLQSVPGGTPTQQFSKAVEQANLQRAQQAKMSGQSAVPTLMNFGNQMGNGQCIICNEEAVDVGATLDNWVKQGNLSPETAKALSQLASKNVSVSDFAAALNDMVKSGKLTPEQARLLLDQYTKQHANASVQNSAKLMDGMIKSGQLPVDAANELLAMQKAGVSTEDYAKKLQELVREGKISPALAQQLLAQYAQMKAKDIIAASISNLHDMAKRGQITPDVESQLTDLENKQVPTDDYASTLQTLITQGKITPAVADKIIKEYKSQKAAIGVTGMANDLVKKAEMSAIAEINDLVSSGKMSPDVGNILLDMMKRNVSFDDYQRAVNQLVQQNKLTPDIAKLKLADYQQVKGLRDLLDRLRGLQGNNASASDYMDALKQAVAAGLITPDQAAQLMDEYQTSLIKAPTAPVTVVSGPQSAQFAKLQERLQGNAAAAQPITVGPEEFAVTKVQTNQENQQAEQQERQRLMSAMSAQAQSLVASWQPPTMVEKVGSYEVKKTTTTTSTSSASGSNSSSSSSTGPTIIKAGTILFAVLDTAVNSDYPDSPVMATIVDGPLKGSKMLGKLTTTKGVAGQLDRVSLNFTLMNNDDWTKSKTVTAYAIDPDTAKTVLASHVDYHYMQRFGAIMATSFVQGYANAISQSASTTTTGIFGTSTTHPTLSPGQKLATAVGQIGTALGNITQNYVNIPPTVKVDSGVGLGILFMSDVT
jgi:type IV secretory pathway VirB10-like protein/polyhydroxyalkanoate synthesis regulator phasin